MASLLIVDDDAEQLGIWRLLLEAVGHQIHSAETVPDALHLLHEIRPDILMMDLRLPRLEDGLFLIRAADAQPKRATIIVLSGWPEDLRDLPEGSKVARIFSKPIRADVLLRVIGELSIS